MEFQRCDRVGNTVSVNFLSHHWRTNLDLVLWWHLIISFEWKLAEQSTKKYRKKTMKQQLSMISLSLWSTSEKYIGAKNELPNSIIVTKDQSRNESKMVNFEALDLPNLISHKISAENHKNCKIFSHLTIVQLP